MLLLLALLLAATGVARAGDAPEWPGWLVGRWDTTAADGPRHITFEPDGTFALGGEPTGGQPWTDAGGKWEARAGSLVVGDASKGEKTVTFRIERPAEEGGRLGLRLIEPGDEAGALVYRKALGRPRWLIGTWITTSAKGPERMLLRADGGAHQIAEVGPDVIDTDRARWEERAGRLLLGEKPTSYEIDLLPPEDGRIRARFRDERPLDRQPIWTRASWLPAQSYDGPLLGRWDVVDTALPVAWLFGPYGRYERRRGFDAGVMVERGVFHVTQGSTGDVLHLESDAGFARSLDLARDGRSLRMTGDGTHGISGVAKFVEGSHLTVSAEAIQETEARANTEARYRFLNDDRRRIAVPSSVPSAPAASKDAGAASGDVPAATDVFAGMEAFDKPRDFRFESEQLLVRDAASRRAVVARTQDEIARAVPGSARPRVVIHLAFATNGRVRETTDAWEKDGTAEPTTVVHHGKYGLQGDVVLVQFGGGEELRWRLGEAGRFLYRGDATFMAALAWKDMGMDGPRWPW